MTTAQVSSTIRYTAPGGGSQTVSLSAAPVYTGSSVGILDIPDLTATHTGYPVPFGSIAAAAVLALKNTNMIDMFVQFNPAGGDTFADAQFRLAPGGELILAQPVAAGGLPVVAVTVYLSAAQTGAGTFEYMVFGA